MIGRSCRPEADSVAEVQAEGRHLAVEADLLRLREARAILSVATPGLMSAIALVHPLARLLVGGDLGAAWPGPTLNVR